MAADDQLTTSAVPGVTSSVSTDYSSPVNNGINIGVQLALRKEQVERQKQELELKQSEAQQQAISGAFDILPKLAKTKGRAKDVMFDLFSQRLQLAGVAVNPQIKDLIGSQDPMAIAVLNAQIRQNPGLLNNPDFMQESSRVFQDPEAYLEWEKSFVAGIQSAQAKNAQLQQEAKAKNNALNVNLIKNGNPAAIDSQGNLIQESADAGSLQNANLKNDAMRMKKQAEDTKLAKLDQDAQYRNALIEQKKAELAQKAELKQAELDIKKSGGTPQQQRTTNSAFNQIMTNSKQLLDVNNRADRGMSLLNKSDVTYGEFKEVLSDYSKLLSGAAGNSITREQGLEGAFSTAADRASALSAKYITNNPSDAVMRPQTVAQLRQDFGRLTSDVKNQYNTLITKHIEGRQALGVFSPEQAQKLSNVFGVKISQDPGESNQPSQPQANNADLFRQQAQKAIAAGKDPVAVKQLYKQKTGQELQ